MVDGMTPRGERQVQRALDTLGIGTPAYVAPEQLPEGDLGRVRQEVRHLLQDLTGSTMGEKALDKIQEVTGQRVRVVDLSPGNLEKLHRALEGERDGHLAEGAGAPSAAAPGETKSAKGGG